MEKLLVRSFRILPMKLAQAGGRDGAALDGALEQARQELKNTLLAG